MRLRKRVGLVLLAVVLFLLLTGQLVVLGDKTEATSDEGQATLTLIGWVANTQDLPVEEAEVRVYIGGERQTLTVAGEEVEAAHTSAEGFYIADLMLSPALLEEDTLAVVVLKPGYRPSHQGFARQAVAHASDRYYVRVPDIILPRVFNPAFFIASGIFLVVFGLISFNVLHETIAAFLGAAAMLAVSYFVGSFDASFWIISFHRAIDFIDFDVIFLLLTMMIFMAVMSQTGVFQWLAFRAFRLARGNAFLVTVVLVIITGATSAVLNDTTVMLLMAPVSIQIALALRIDPATIVVPEILASNIGGAATLIGTPPNTIIGSYVGLSFNQFLAHMLPIAVLGMIILILMTRWLYRKEFGKERTSASHPLVKQLETGARITDGALLTKSLILFGITMLLFFVEDLFHMPPAVVAILGSTALLLWVRPDVGEMLHEVDWTTLVFFMCLFMMVGGVQEVGLIQIIAESVKRMAGENLLVATLLVIWVSAVASAVVANIPFAAAMVPVTVYLTHTIPGAGNNVLYWALALGAGLGGNATYIGSAPNIVAAGILDRAGFRLTFGDFSKVGVPVTFVTILVPTLWILLRYFVLGF
jgi:Na+/H+ antiporter NhaD/arsenite permease-like protein